MYAHCSFDRLRSHWQGLAKDCRRPFVQTSHISSRRGNSAQMARSLLLVEAKVE